MVPNKVDERRHGLPVPANSPSRIHRQSRIACERMSRAEAKSIAVVHVTALRAPLSRVRNGAPSTRGNRQRDIECKSAGLQLYRPATISILLLKCPATVGNMCNAGCADCDEPFTQPPETTGDYLNSIGLVVRPRCTLSYIRMIFRLLPDVCGRRAANGVSVCLVVLGFVQSRFIGLEVS
jgi:hypothetical protein